MPATLSRLAGAAVAAALILASAPAASQQVVQARGVDSRVDYDSLKQFGPWDDRNYQLNADDLRVLSRDEVDLRVLIPAFYRIQLRRALLDEGQELVLYPRSALPRFFTYFGGYLIDGRLYAGAEKTDDGYVVRMQSESQTPFEFIMKRLGRGADVEVVVDMDAAESAVSINPVNPDLVVAGFNGTPFGQHQWYSTDGGSTWTASDANPGATDSPIFPGSCCDPTFSWKSDGSVVYAATLDFSTNDFYYSTDSGQTWQQGTGIGTSTDKEYLHTDNFPSSPGRDNTYLSWHEGNIQHFAFLETNASGIPTGWTSEQVFSGEPRGIGSDLTTDKAGNVYFLYPTFTGGTSGPGTIRLLKGTITNGTPDTFSFAGSTVATTEDEFDWPVPSMDQRLVFQYVSADVDYTDGPYADSIYASWTDNTGPQQSGAANNHARIQVAYSRNGGSSWTVVTPHSTANLLTVDRYHQWLKVGPDGTLHLIYYSTEFSGDPTRETVDLAYQNSTDGGQTWSTPERLTTASSPDVNDSFEFGDYNGLDVVMNNLVTIYTDSRRDNGSGGAEVDIYVIRRELGGPEIFADGFESSDTTAWAATVP